MTLNPPMMQVGDEKIAPLADRDKLNSVINLDLGRKKGEKP